MPDAPITETRRFTPVFVIACLVIVTAVGLRIHDAWKARRVILAEMTLKGRTFIVEVADTDKKKEVGLGKRNGLSADRGMYFPFHSAQSLVFWMKDMRFPIDIVWISDGRVVDIDASVPVEKNNEHLTTYRPIEPADAVLELNAGMAEKMGVEKGDEVELRPIR